MKKMFKKREKIINFYIYLTAGIFPLFFTSYYNNIQSAKSRYFIAVTFAVGILLLLCAIVNKKRISQGRMKLYSAEICFFLFGISALLSAAFSTYGRKAFTGGGGRYIGAVSLIAMCISFFIFARNKADTETFAQAFLVSAVMVEILGILHFVDIDFWGFTENVPQDMKGMFLSTIGNNNVFAGFAAACTAFSMAYYCLKGNKILLIPSATGFLALFAGNSDTGFLGIFAGFAFLPLMFYEKRMYVKRIVEEIACFFITCFLADCVSVYTVRRYTNLPRYFSRLEFYLPGLFISLLIFLIICMIVREEAWKKAAAKLHKIYLICVATGAAGMCLLLILANTGILPGPGFLVIGDSWGSNRGYIWKKILEIFREASDFRKIIGYGPDTLKLLLLETEKEEIILTTGQIYDSAHNDVLQYLITMGVIGAAAWVSSFLCTCYCVWNTHEKDIYPWLVPVICFFIQGLISVSQPVTTPFYFLMAGICINQVHKWEEKNS